MNEHATQTERQSRLQYFPVNIFAIAMGLGGFAIVTHKFEEVLGWTTPLSGAILGFTLIVSALLAAFYLFKAARYPEAIRMEWRHPIKISFFPAITISLVILSVALMPISTTASAVFWWIGAPLNLVATLAVIRYWIREGHYEPTHLNPAWFIPAVGNILVPIAGPLHAPAEVSWFFFSVGMLFWVNLMVIIFNRLIFHHPIPERMLPTLFILVAPPAVGFLAYTRLMPEGLDPFSRFLFYSGIFFALLLLTKVNILIKLKFSLSWWAYSFPFSALILSMFRFGELADASLVTQAGIWLYVLQALQIIVLLAWTANKMLKSQICVPE